MSFTLTTEDKESLDNYGTKKCTKNGTWWRDPVSNREWTDYTPCLNLRIYKTMVYVGVICCSISLILLIPASLTFICLRQLRTQNRIRLHLCLFLSFILTCVTTLIWDIFIYNDRLDNPPSKTRMQQNTIICRVLYTFNRYANSSNYFWMFCEGHYLHKLVLHAFKVPTNLAWYYIVGWGGALTPVIAYLIIRLQIADNECWVKNIGIYEWIIYIPNLLCILMNVVFLCSILKILLTGLQNHPNEPSNFRRGIKATFLLVPLFGIQLFFIIYRPPEETAYRFPYEVISKFIIDSQGAIVSLVFCYMNSEVHSSLKYCWHGTELPCTRGNQRDFVNNFSASHISLTNIRSNIQMNGYNKAFQLKKAIKIDDKTHEYVFA
ncbi:unnamed protein product [Mytilus edulis]|uniref:G-protein coupled receptors family 2 profile 2 domain-containing protein n=1 Tax=Mytilus edulis TaxID=6550 RepID=A0A8S3UDF8_MYTED|nr:unnamed protein product [Mytilus edulis]